MIVLILDQLGCYASVAAASYLAGLIDLEASPQDIYNLPGFAAHRDMQVGRIYYIGEDGAGNAYYSIGTGNEEEVLLRSIEDVAALLANREHVLAIGVSAYNTLGLRLLANLMRFSPLRSVVGMLAARLVKRSFLHVADYAQTQVYARLRRKPDIQDCLDAP
ncbi:MAG: DUF3189 family protein [Clostridia bacterium]|jgi:hypothetical protein|nr:DUF3189 family protein [Clostridia bacterium]